MHALSAVFAGFSYNWNGAFYFRHCTKCHTHTRTHTHTHTHMHNRETTN